MKSENAIVWLCRSQKSQIKQLLHSMELIEKNFLPHSNADLWVFHEHDFPKECLLDEPVAQRLRVRLAEVDFSEFHTDFDQLTKGQRGYRHMCHFFANDIFLRPELQSYKYQMRLDVDSYILSPVPFDVFGKMRDGDFRYAWRMEMNERAEVSQGLLETANSFFANTLHFKPFTKVKLYYTNFEICDLSFFRLEAWQSFFAAIDKAGGIWQNRWGDAPIRWLGVQGILGGGKTICMKEIDYFHQFRLRKGWKHRTPLEYIRYASSLALVLLKRR